MQVVEAIGGDETTKEGGKRQRRGTGLPSGYVGSRSLGKKGEPAKEAAKSGGLWADANIIDQRSECVRRPHFTVSNVTEWARKRGTSSKLENRKMVSPDKGNFRRRGVKSVAKLWRVENQTKRKRNWEKQSNH